MDTSKKIFLQNFDKSLSPSNSKCSFKLINGTICQGWIDEILENTFIFYDSSPFADEDPYLIKIEEIDPYSFSYWDEEESKWIMYPL